MQSEETQSRAPRGPTLGQVLLESKLITEEDLEKALEIQRRGDGRRLGHILIENRWLDAENLAMALSVHLTVPFIDLRRHAVSPEALRVVPEAIARKHRLIPLDLVGGSLVVVMEDPTDIRVIEEVSALSGLHVTPTVGVGSDIQAAIDLYFKAKSEIEREVAEFAPRAEVPEAGDGRGLAEAVAEDPVVRAVDLILEQAVRDRASDIHIEPNREAVRVRYRIDGSLQEILSLPKASHQPLLSRIKVLAGQFSIRRGDEEVYFRVATSDTTWGEMASLRVLGRLAMIFDLTALGLQPEALALTQRISQSPFGMILVSGPTGSGKTTTLYSIINQLDREHRNIMTIEDPVEYNFENVNQIQVNRAADITFASGLRAIMRLDPDIIMVGEIRDPETAEAATQAALTGHLVLSSIHANDAPGALYRLAHLGVERHLLVSAVIGVVAQRLVRRVCPHCKTLVDPTPEEQEAFQAVMDETLGQYHAGEGCTYCVRTGYLGRTGVFEILVMSRATRRLLIEGRGVDELKAQAVEDGLTTMRYDGMLKVKQGITTPREVMRSVYSLV
jgi:general secretion pathway protein E